MNRRGLTLLEMVISLGILTIVMGGATYGILLSGRALQVSTQSASGTRSSAEALSQLLAELQTATGVSERTATAVTFTVPDRNQDAQAETIRYSWSAAPGAPLYRQYNNEAPVVIAANVQQFSLSFLTETVQPANQDTLLIQHLDGSGGSTVTFTEARTDWCGQYFKPTLPANATGWKITKVSLYCKRRSGATPGLLVNVRLVYPTAQQKPGNVILDSVSLNPFDLDSSFAWKDFTFTNSTYLPPTQGMCLVVAQVVNGRSIRVQYESSGSQMTPNSFFTSSSDGGSSWTGSTDTNDMIFKVYGVIQTNGSPP